MNEKSFTVYRKDFKQFEKRDYVLMNMPSFNHICYFNLHNVSSSRVDVILDLVNSNIGVFKPYLKRFRKLYKRNMNLGFTVNKECLLAVIKRIEFVIAYKNSRVFLRRDISENYNKYYSLLKSKYKTDSCNYCQSNDFIQIDHIIAISKGGKNDLSNLQFLCRTCNLKKSNK